MEKLYLSGAGEMITKLSGGGILKFGTMQNLSLAVTATFKELFAGKGMFPVAARAFDKSIEAGCDMASFDKDFIEISQGLDTSDPANVDRWESAEVQEVSGGAVTVDKSAYKAGYTYVEDANGNKLTLSASAPASGEYQESDPAAGEITVNANLEGANIYVSYVYSYDYSGNADSVELLMVKADVMPKEFELYFKCTLTEGGTVRGVEIVFWKCKPTTDMKLTFARDFNIPNFSFKILDPKRPDGRIGYYILL